jgi:leucyl-tRNA synthetase
MPIDQYIGGAEHAVLHLMYARFFTKALSDLRIAPKGLREPFQRLFTQGMIRLAGSKMSKSKGNLVTPEEIIDSHGADALRLAHLAAKPPDEDVDWEDFGLEGCSRFLARVWRLCVPGTDLVVDLRSGAESDADRAIERARHRLIEDITVDFDRWSYNTAVAKLMAYTNDLYRYVQATELPRPETLDAALDTLLELLAPACPHLAAELWDRRHAGEHVHERPWPVADTAMLVSEVVEIPVQIDGKVKARLVLSAEATPAEAEAAALADERIAELLAGATPKKVVVVPGRLVNIVR